MATTEAARAEAFAKQADRSRELAAGYVQQALGNANAIRQMKAAVDTALNTIALPHRWAGTVLELLSPNGEWVTGPDLRGIRGVGLQNAALDEKAHLILTFENGDVVDAGEMPAGPPGNDGADGVDGTNGTNGNDGDDGANGWTPELAAVVDGDRRVHQIVDWVGGTGTKPATGKYVGPTGPVDTAAEAVDVRGTPGAAGTGTGDMVASTYDPDGKAANVYSADNHVDGSTNKVFTASEKTKLAGIESAADVTDAANVGSVIHGATAKTTPVDADTLPLIDSAASNGLKKVTWARVKAVLKTYFDTLYQPIFTTLTSLSFGFTTTAVNDGTKSSGTYTPSPSGGNIRRAVNGGAHTLAAPSATGDYTMIVKYTNNGSAGAITLSGFTVVTGDEFTTTNGHKFLVYIAKVDGDEHANVVALQ